MRIVVAVPCLWLLTALAHAQAPFPGAVSVNGGWVPCDHPIAVDAGNGCGVQAPTPPVPPDFPTPPCPEPFNPYGVTDEVLARCLSKPPLKNPWTGAPFAFEIGEVYRDAYDARAIVLGITTDIGSPRRIITVRIIRSSAAHERGLLQAVYEDRARWMPLMPGEKK
jgi:hypothetical protein